jgi:ribosomal protein S18 acetylase RimI-like enzyme
MIKISETTWEEIKDFNEKEWYKADVEHYGKVVGWNEKKFFFKATEDEKIVGTITGKYESGVIYIGDVITVQEFRRKGIGTMLINKAEEFGKSLGAHKMWLITGKDWSEVEFYKKLGFKIEGVLPNHHFHKDFVIFARLIK